MKAYHYSDRGTEYCDERVCLSLRVSACVCLSVHDHIFGTIRLYIHQMFLRMLLMDVARSSSGFQRFSFQTQARQSCNSGRCRELETPMQLYTANEGCNLKLSSYYRFSLISFLSAHLAVPIAATCVRPQLVGMQQ